MASPSALVVPFKAIRVFFDPSVRYGLQFESVAAMESANEIDGLDTPFDDPFADRDFSGSRPSAVPLKRDPPVRSTQEAVPSVAAKPKPLSRVKDEGDDENFQDLDHHDLEVAEADAIVDDGDDRGAEIVSLDAFRKK